MSSVPVAQQLELGGVVFIVTLGTVGEEPSIGSLTFRRYGGKVGSMA